MTESKQGKSHKLMFIDISRAHFHSPSRRRVFVELPPERERAGFCGPLFESMHGTRDTKVNFAAIVMVTLTNMKFEIGKFHPCLCKHASMDIAPFHHGDDFAVLADDGSLFCSQGNGEVDVSAKHHGVGNGEEVVGTSWASREWCRDS